MTKELIATNAAEINALILESRRSFGSSALTAVLTLVIITDEEGHYDALRAATTASRAHPSRILAVIRRQADREGSRLDAEVRISGENGPGDVVTLRMYGELAHHPGSVVLPLLLPETPVVAWWPRAAPDIPAEDPLGALASRRITDAMTHPIPSQEISHRVPGYRPGDTDLAWTRLTTWRAMLASTLDAPYGTITGGVVEGEAESSSATLLRAWLQDRLQVPITHHDTGGPGMSAVILHTTKGDISLSRTDTGMATLVRPGWPHREVALKRRSTAELLTEELRRLDPDDIYGATLQALPAVLADSSPKKAKPMPISHNEKAMKVTTVSTSTAGGSTKASTTRTTAKKTPSGQAS